MNKRDGSSTTQWCTKQILKCVKQLKKTTDAAKQHKRKNCYLTRWRKMEASVRVAPPGE